MSDYPFSNWEDFFNAFNYVLRFTENKNYKNYNQMINNFNNSKHGVDVNVEITRQMLDEKNDAQEGLDTLIDAVVYGYYNVKEDCYNSIRDISKLLISHGAKVTDSRIKFILKPFIGCFDHHSILCDNRAVLLHIFGTKFGLPIINEETQKLPYYNSYKNLDVNSLEYIDAFHRILKYKIKELQMDQIKSNDLL